MDLRIIQEGQEDIVHRYFYLYKSSILLSKANYEKYPRLLIEILDKLFDRIKELYPQIDLNKKWYIRVQTYKIVVSDTEKWHC